MTPDSLDAQRRVRRWTRFERGLVGAIMVGTLIGMGTAGLALARQDDIRDQTHKLNCSARLQSDFMAAVGDALNAPPAPNPARGVAVAEIQRTAKQLHRIDEVCQ